MKNAITLLILISMIRFSFAQEIAMDFTKTDCALTEHNLFETLDTGAVVVMEIVMLGGCMPCITTAHLIEPVIAEYNTEYNNRILWFTFGYNDSYSCIDLASWKYDNGIACNAEFVEGSDLADYYGGMGMPTLVVAGRNTHTVYLNQFGFIPADTINFKQAIEYALGIADPVSIPKENPRSLIIQPNPANDLIHFGDLQFKNGQANIYNLNAELVAQINIESNAIEISSLVSGNYFIRVIADDGNWQGTFVKQ
ncbi:MAG: T9SS type A sorting domain-containing protein [Chitinophagales bacterium]